MRDESRIRPATEHDVPAMLAVYAPYVEHTAITFEYEVPSEQEFRNRLANVLARYPWLVAEQDGSVLGYAYASAFHSRAAYGWCAEVSIYLSEDRRGQGLGARLYRKMEEILRAQHILVLYACIASSSVESERLTHASIRFHRREGYHIVGEFPLCGFKFDRWYDMVWMEKRLAEPLSPPKAVIPFPLVKSRLFPD